MHETAANPCRCKEDGLLTPKALAGYLYEKANCNEYAKPYVSLINFSAAFLALMSVLCFLSSHGQDIYEVVDITRAVHHFNRAHNLPVTDSQHPLRGYPNGAVPKDLSGSSSAQSLSAGNITSSIADIAFYILRPTSISQPCLFIAGWNTKVCVRLVLSVVASYPPVPIYLSTANVFTLKSFSFAIWWLWSGRF